MDTMQLSEKQYDRSPRHQSALILQAIKQPYVLVTNHAVPSLIHPDEILIKVSAIGLNPVDWKAPAFNFGIPVLPWVFGRDLAGVVIETKTKSDRIKVGDLVLVPSTDYRDIRKAAFQEYTVASEYNAARIPRNISYCEGASLGVAYVAAALALGVCFGLDFATATPTPGPDLIGIISRSDWTRAEIPQDIEEECLSCAGGYRLQRGDWVAIWGASATTGYIITQLAKRCGLKVICVADVARHGPQLLSAGAELLVDRYDTSRSIEIIRGVTKGNLKYGIDMVGRGTAVILQEALFSSSGESHLLGITGLPKDADRHKHIRYHTVPIKLFHSCAPIGEALMGWLECLLQTETLVPPDLIVRKDNGLAEVNDALSLLRGGKASGKRIVVDLDRTVPLSSQHRGVCEHSPNFEGLGLAITQEDVV